MSGNQQVRKRGQASSRYSDDLSNHADHKSRHGKKQGKSSGWCKKLVFFFLISFFGLFAAVRYIGYEKLDKAYGSFVPKPVRETLSSVNDKTEQGVQFVRRSLRGVNLAGVDLEEFFFAGEIEADLIKEQEELRLKKIVDNMDLDIQANEQQEETKRNSAQKAKKPLHFNENRLDAARKAGKIAKDIKAQEESDDSDLDRWQYSKSDITSKDDFSIKDALDAAEGLIDSDAKQAVAQFDKLLKETSGHTSPRAMFGKAKALNAMAEQLKSNEVLEEAIELLMDLLELEPETVPDELFRTAGNFCIERMQFRGWDDQAVEVIQFMLERFPKDIKLLNTLGNQLLIVGKPEPAQAAFEAVLLKDPLNNYAAKNLGVILKRSDRDPGDLARGVELILQGMKNDQDPPDGKFYFHLGEGLKRLGREEEADAVYKEGVEKGLFRNFWQRSLYNVDYLRGKPVWSKEETGQAWALEQLQANWEVIRDEALALLKDDESGFEPDSENLKDTGRWTQFRLFVEGKEVAGCAKAPKTCEMVKAIPAATTNTRGQVKFSVMYPGTHVHAHTGATNCRLRVHLGLKVPRGEADLKLRVADQYLEWEEGKMFVFDDSYDHEVWNQRDAERVIFIVDLWHPDLDEATKASLPP